MALHKDILFGVRALARNKGWTAVAAAALTLGLGANIAIFSLVRLMIWTPLPYPNQSELAYLVQTSVERGFRSAAVSLPDVEAWAGASAIKSISAYRGRPVAFSGSGEPTTLSAMQVTPEFFSVMGVSPAMGRAFNASEGPETESRVAVLSYEAWQEIFRGDPAAIGREVRLDGRAHVIVGVMPSGFRYLYQPVQIFTPLTLTAKERALSYRGLSTVARLKPGVSVEGARAEVRAISERLEAAHPDGGRGWRGDVRPLAYRIMGDGARAAGFTMLGGVGFVLLIACSNVASLLLARGTLRRRELALRASLGCTRWALVRLQVVESVLLSLVAGAAGLVSAIWSIPLLKTIAPEDMTIFQTAGLDWTALVFGFALSLVTGVVFGAMPALVLTGGDLATKLRESGRGSTGGRHILLKAIVAGELALALVLVAATTLLVRSSIRSTTAAPGFDQSNLTIANVLLPQAKYTEPAKIVEFYSQALATLRRDASLESAALVQTMPLAGDNSYSGLVLDGDNSAEPDKTVGSMIVSPGYFHTLRIGVVSGRDFTEADREGSLPVAIVNQAFIRRYWPNEQNPVGRRLKVGGKESPWLTVVGLVRDVKHTDVVDPPRPEVFRPHAQTAATIMTLVARSRSGQSAAGAMRAAVRQADPEQPLFRAQSFQETLAMRRSGSTATAKVLGMLAAIAVLLAAVGAYGVMAYAEAGRSREIGIRMAVGATPAQVFASSVRGAAKLACAGLVIGLPAAYLVSPLLRAFDNAVNGREPQTYIWVGALLFGVAIAACLPPAWKLSRTDPSSVLRAE